MNFLKSFLLILLSFLYAFPAMAQFDDEIDETEDFDADHRKIGWCSGNRLSLPTVTCCTLVG